jgi:hypothetical protein
MSSECAFQLRCSRHHEAQLGMLLREFSLDVQKIRTGNMRVHERVQPGYDDVREITSRWLVIETGRTIENANVGLVQNLSKLFATDEFAVHGLPQWL